MSSGLIQKFQAIESDKQTRISNISELGMLCTIFRCVENDVPGNFLLGLIHKSIVTFKIFPGSWVIAMSTHFFGHNSREKA